MNYTGRNPDTLYINLTDSKCGNCGASVDPLKRSCDVQLGYGPQNGEPGCGQVWTKLSSDYVRLPGLYEAAMKMRPDLEPDFKVGRV